MTYSNLRAVDATLLNRYFEKREADISDTDGEESSFDEGTVVYHSWKPGFLELTDEQGAAVAELSASKADANTSALHGAVHEALHELGWLEDVAPDIDALIERTKGEFTACQNPWELGRFLRLVQQRKPNVVVEIGTAAGGMLYCMTQLAAEDALIVSIDLPSGPYGGGQENWEVEVFSSFARPRQQMEFIRGRSFNYSSLMKVEELLAGRGIDLLFIDGDHSYGAVRSDFLMYSPLVAKDGISCFHDLVLRPEHWGPGLDAGVAWDHIRAGHEAVEFIDPKGTTTPPAEIPKTYEGLSKQAWGIGVLFHGGRAAV